MRSYVAAAGLICVSACGPPHVALDAPARSAPPEARLSAYEKLRPRSPLEAQGAPRGEIPRSYLRTTDAIELGSGAKVHYARDLRPVLDEQSTAAREADLEASRSTAADVLTAAGAVLLVVGTAVAVSPFVTTDKGEALPTQPIFVGTGLAVLSIPAFLFASERRRSAADARSNAFETYELGLKRRLDLCGYEPNVAPCATVGAWARD